MNGYFDAGMVASSALEGLKPAISITGFVILLEITIFYG
jgi:hypothetical protein